MRRLQPPICFFWTEVIGWTRWKRPLSKLLMRAQRRPCVRACVRVCVQCRQRARVSVGAASDQTHSIARPSGQASTDSRGTSSLPPRPPSRQPPWPWMMRGLSAAAAAGAPERTSWPCGCGSICPTAYPFLRAQAGTVPRVSVHARATPRPRRPSRAPCRPQTGRPLPCRLSQISTHRSLSPCRSHRDQPTCSLRPPTPARPRDHSGRRPACTGRTQIRSDHTSTTHKRSQVPLNAVRERPL
jgi:hypothetical protein